MNAKHAKRLRRVARATVLNYAKAVDYNNVVAKAVPHVQLQLQADGTSLPVVMWVDKITRHLAYSVRWQYRQLKRDFPRPNGRLSPA